MEDTNCSLSGFDLFKADLLKWKEEHIDEYNRFARLMKSGSDTGFIMFFKYVMAKNQALARMWKGHWDSDSIRNFDNILVRIPTIATPAAIIREFSGLATNTTSADDGKASLWKAVKSLLFDKKIKLSSGLILSWLVYGDSFEAMVDILNKMMNLDKADNIDRERCAMTIRMVIKSSIDSGYRTPEDWDEYQSIKGAIASGDAANWALDSIKADSELIEKEEDENAGIAIEEENKRPGRPISKDKKLEEYLNTSYKEEVLRVIRDFIIANNTGAGLAMPFFALQELGLLTGNLIDTEYSTAIVKQFGDIEGLKTERTCRGSLNKLRTETYINVDGKKKKGQLLRDDNFSAKIERLKDEIRQAIAAGSKDSEQFVK